MTHLEELKVIRVSLERKHLSQPFQDGKAGIGLAFIREGPNFVVKHLAVDGSAARSLQVVGQLSMLKLNFGSIGFV